MILIDGIKYMYLTPDSEATLEGQIEENYKHIFGEKAIYFPKKKIKSKAGIGTIPDAYLIIPGKKLRWCMLEVELASHSVYDHVFPQLTKFRRAIEGSASRKKITEFFYDYIKSDEVLEAQFRKQIGTGEIYKSISDMVNEKPLIVVAIDQRTDELEEALLGLGGDVKVVEFKTYRRQGSTEINAYMFEPAITLGKNDTGVRIQPVGDNASKRGGGIKNAIYMLFDEKGVDNVTYDECEAAAKKAKPDSAFNKNHFSWYKNQYKKSRKYSGGLRSSGNKLGALPEGLKIFGDYKSLRFTAEVIQDGKIRFDGEVFSSPSLAAITAIQSTGSSRETENGWRWWKFIDPKTGEESSIDVLREK